MHVKLVRYGLRGLERPGLLDSTGTIRDLSELVSEFEGAAFGPRGLAELEALNLASLPSITGSPRLGACVARPGKFICIGLNYTDHAAETGAEIPK